MGLTHLLKHKFETLHDIYLERAERLADRQWQGGLYEAFDDVLSLLEEGHEEEAEEILAELEEHIVNVYESYTGSYVVGSELSLLGLLAHRWLQEAVEHLLEATAILLHANTTEEAESSLEAAEWGCRLLVIVSELSHQQEAKVQEAA